MREMGYDDEPWEGVQSSGPSLPITLVGPVGSVADPLYTPTFLELIDRHGWPGGYLYWNDFHIDFDENADAHLTEPWGRPEEPR